VPHGIHPDEVMNGSNALEVIKTGRPRIFYPENNGREGLFINAQTISIALFENTEFALRLPSAILGVLTVFGLYCLGTELAGAPAGLLAAFFLATRWHINSSRMGTRGIATPFFLVWSVYLLLRAWRSLRADAGHALWAAGAGAVYGLGFQPISHIESRRP